MSDDKTKPGPFSIGSAVWPGTSRVLEEGGELVRWHADALAADEAS